jgi:hypothetical protein
MGKADALWLNRRNFIALAASGLASASRAAEQVWNDKAPAEWDAGDAYVVLNKSPWAKHVDAEFQNPRSRMNAFSAPGGPWPFPKRRQVVVLWESAAPVRLALKRRQAPPANRYVISVDGLPLAQSRGDTLNYLRPFASLRGSSKTEVRPLLVRREVRTSLVYVFEFPKNAVEIESDSKEAVFEVNFSGWMVKAKFIPREMFYRGELAL